MKRYILTYIVLIATCFANEGLQKEGALHFLPKIKEAWNKSDIDAFMNLYSPDSKLRAAWSDEKSRPVIKKEFLQMISEFGSIEETTLGLFVASKDRYVFKNTYEKKGVIPGTISTVKKDGEWYISDWNIDGKGEPELQGSTSSDSSAQKKSLNDALDEYFKAMKAGDHDYTVDRMDPVLFSSDEEREKLRKMLKGMQDNVEYSNISHGEPHHTFWDERGIRYLLDYQATIKMGEKEGILHSTMLASYDIQTKKWFFGDVGGKDWQQMRQFYPSFPKSILDRSYEELR